MRRRSAVATTVRRLLGGTGEIGQDGLVEPEHLEAEIGTHHQAGGAPGAAGVQLRVAVAELVDVGGHRQDAAAGMR